MRYSVSNTAEYGDYESGRRVINDSTRKEMKRILAEIKSGEFAKRWIAENEADIEVICDLQYSRATSKPTRWVLVVPEDSPIQSVADLAGKRIATEAISLTKNYLAENAL